ncbi:MAG: hypothetical protein ABS76_33630 [Pelagibacterium sp. SCN 64-44]|nr:MAG: hypothetical protein ABS76_33630 [Pelagibacterium sp. SCN 64-44]
MSPMTLSDLMGGLIVSCQAPDESPLRRVEMMVAMAQAAFHGGARGIRAQGVADIRAIAAAVDLPIIGLKKAPPLTPDRVFITPRIADAVELVEAGAKIVALDATPRPRDGNDDVRAIVRAVHEMGAFVMADVDSVASAIFAQDSGADIIGTTLVGYTDDTIKDARDAIDISVLSQIVGAVSAPVLAEGRIWTPDDALAAFDVGAAGVVVGTAITNPLSLTRRFSAAIAAVR